MLPSQPSIIIDTETGGLSPERNPLLSIGLLLATPRERIDSLSIKCSPPANTWLEVPIPADQLKGKYSKTFSHWLNLTTDEKIIPLPEKPPSFITAVAAEVNGFVGSSETVPGWDMSKTKTWGTHTYPQAAEAIMSWVEKHRSVNPQAVICHNASFDHGFINGWLPEILLALPMTWACTQKAYKDKFLGGKTKGSSLENICKIAGYAPSPEDTYHTDIGDCKATHFIWGWLKSQGA